MNLKMRLYRSLPTQRVSTSGSIDENDFVAIETALEIQLNREFLAAIVCSPGLEKELSIGYLLSTGIIESPEDIAQASYSSNRCFITLRDEASPKIERGLSRIRRFIGTECSAPEVLRVLRTASGIPSVKKRARIDYKAVFGAAEQLREAQIARKKTGALHGALLHSMIDDRYTFAEDLGRHNAVDKAIGLAVQQKLELTSCFIITSGRLTADMVSKCAWASIPLLVSFSVSTDAGVKFAQKANLTLVGALKGEKMRIYNRGACDMSGPNGLTISH